MKKPLLILAILLLLAASVGVWNIHTDPADQAKEQSRMMNPGTDSRKQRPLPREARSIPDPPLLASADEPGIRRQENAEDPKIPERATPARNSAEEVPTGRPLQQIYFFHSQTIIGADPMNQAAVDRLRRALASVSGTLGNTSLILDADSHVTSESPFILFGKPRHDLTDQIQAAYQQADPKNQDATRQRAEK